MKRRIKKTSKKSGENLLLSQRAKAFYPLSEVIPIPRPLGVDFLLNNCIFSDFPNDNNEYIDTDNDGLYLADNCNVYINGSVFLNAKDDGLDSGSAVGGNIVVENSVFESCFHESAALSSYEGTQKTQEFNNCLFRNCGQGLEFGFSMKDIK